MNATTPRLSESFELTKSSEPTARVGSAAQPFSTRLLPVLSVVAAGNIEAPISRGYRELDSMVADLEREPNWRQELKHARSWMAETVLAGKPVTLRTLRLKKGMSQAQLAEVIGTQQPYIARIESGSADLRLETCRRLANALGIDLNTLSLALQTQRTA